MRALADADARTPLADQALLVQVPTRRAGRFAVECSRLPVVPELSFQGLNALQQLVNVLVKG